MPKISKDISAWFDYPDDPLNGKVNVRLPKSGEVQSAVEKTMEIKYVWDEETQKAEPVIGRSGTKASIVQLAVLDWKNFFDANDKPMKCTPANIKAMCCEDGFAMFIDECVSKLEKEHLKKEADILGNS